MDFGNAGIASGIDMPREGLVQFGQFVVGIGVEPVERPAGREAVQHHRIAVELAAVDLADVELRVRSEEHTSELQSLMRNSYAVFCLKKQTEHPIPLQIHFN